MKAYDIIGYVINECIIICKNCFDSKIDNDNNPIFSMMSLIMNNIVIIVMKVWK